MRDNLFDSSHLTCYQTKMCFFLDYFEQLIIRIHY